MPTVSHTRRSRKKPKNLKQSTSKAVPPDWLVRLVAQIGVPQEWHDLDAPEVVLDMARRAEDFHRRAALIDRLFELADTLKAEADQPGRETFVGISNALRMLGNLADLEQELVVTPLRGGRRGFVVVLGRAA